MIKSSVSLSGGAMDWLLHVGHKAPLNEDGYRAVVFARNDTEMLYFINRTAMKEDMKIPELSSLLGMTPYYSGLCARQSFDALVSELHTMMPSQYLNIVGDAGQILRGHHRVQL